MPGGQRSTDAAGPLRAEPAPAPHGRAAGFLGLAQRFAGNRAMAAAFGGSAPEAAVPVGRPAPAGASLEDPSFNAGSRAHDLVRAINSAEHDYRVKPGSGFAGGLQEDVAAERRHVDFAAAVAALDGLTASQVGAVAQAFLAFDKTPLREALFGGGASGRSADLTPDQIARLEVLMRGTRPEPIPPEVMAELRAYPTDIAVRLKADLERKADAGTALNRLEADAIELHELFARELDEGRRERVMTLHRRPLTEIDALDALYDQRYGEGKLAYVIHLRLDGLQLTRLGQLRIGNLAQADACAIEDKRRQIEELTKPVDGPYGFVLEEQRKEKRQKLTGDIQAILDLNRREALADPTNAGRGAGEVIAERLATIVDQQHGEAGNTLGAELARTLGPQDAAVLAAATDRWNTGGSDNLIEAAAAQLAADEKAGRTSAKRIATTLQSFRELARRDLVAQAYRGTLPPEQRQALLDGGDTAVTRLAQHYIERYREAYDRIAGGDGRTYAEIVASASDANETYLGNLATGGGQTSDLGELHHAMGTKDVEKLKAVLQRQPDRETLDALVAAYDRVYGRDLRKELFGALPGGQAASPELARVGLAGFGVRGLVTGRDAAQVEEQLAKPAAAEMTGPGEARWITAGGLAEYDATMANRGLTGRLREIGDDPETQRLLERTRDDLSAAAKRFATEQDPAQRARLLLEMRRLRATLTGDAAAYEQDNARMLAQIQSALSFAVSIALAVAIPGAGPGVVAFLQTTAVNIAANVASNFVIKMGDYGLADLKADVLGGALGAGGAKFGEELMGRVAAAVVKPAADATAETAGRLGVQTALSREATALSTGGARVAIEAAEFEIKVGAAGWEVAAREVGGFAGGMYAPKTLTGDYGLSVEEVLKALVTTAAGKIAHRPKSGSSEEPARRPDEESGSPARRPDDGGVPVGGAFHPEPAPPSHADVFGPRSPQQMLLDNGIPPASAQGFQQVADGFNVVITVRPTNTASLDVLAAGGVAKPELIKAKTVNRTDLLIGGPAGGLGKVGFFEPVMPSEQILSVLSPEARAAVESRYAQRAEEFAHYRDEYGRLAAEGLLRVQDGVLQIADPRTAATLDAPMGRFADIGGDHDLFQITSADGTPLHPDVRRGVITTLRSMGINVEHGDHTSWQADSPQTYDAGADAAIRAQHETSEPLVAFVPKSQPREVMAGDAVTGPPRTEGPGDRHLPAGKAQVVDPTTPRDPSPMMGQARTAGSMTISEAAKRTAARLHEVHRDWHIFEPEVRASLLVSAVQVELAHTGVPVPDILPIGGDHSFFDADVWQIRLGHPALADPHPSVTDFALACDHARHEMEHAVLDFRIARQAAAADPAADAATLAARLGLPVPVVRRAIDVNAEAGTYEAIADTPLAAQAAEINESLRGRGARDRSRIMAAIKAADEALTAAKASTDPDAANRIDAAQQAYDKAAVEYADLPDEVLAWDAGRQIQIAVRMHDALLVSITKAETTLSEAGAALAEALTRSGADKEVAALNATVTATRKWLDEMLADLAKAGGRR
jgi:hypothetical protein